MSEASPGAVLTSQRPDACHVRYVVFGLIVYCYYQIRRQRLFTQHLIELLGGMKKELRCVVDNLNSVLATHQIELCPAIDQVQQAGKRMSWLCDELFGAVILGEQTAMEMMARMERELAAVKPEDDEEVKV